MQDLPVSKYCWRSTDWPFRFRFPFPFPFPTPIAHCYSHFLLLIWSARTSCNCCASLPPVAVVLPCFLSAAHSAVPLLHFLWVSSQCWPKHSIVPQLLRSFAHCVSRRATEVNSMGLIGRCMRKLNIIPNALLCGFISFNKDIYLTAILWDYRNVNTKI